MNWTELLREEIETTSKVTEAGEEDLANRDTHAPGDPDPMKLGQRLLHMVGQLNNHKA